MLVYRVEKENGRGPYIGGSIEYVSAHTRQNFDTHPTPYRDGIENFQNKDYCGFESMANLDTWFATCHGPLHYSGFAISVYKVLKRYVKFGQYQVVFRRERAQLVKRIPLWQDVPSWYCC